MSGANNTSKLLGAERWTEGKADYYFEEPPQSISLNVGESATKTILSFYNAHPAEVANVISNEEERNNFIKFHALFEKTVASLYHEALYKIPYLKRVDFFRNTLAPVDRQKALVMGELMENESFLRCIMAHEPDTRNTRASIFENAWKRVMGTDIASLIKDVAQQSDDR